MRRLLVGGWSREVESDGGSCCDIVVPAFVECVEGGCGGNSCVGGSGRLARKSDAR